MKCRRVISLALLNCLTAFAVQAGAQEAAPGRRPPDLKGKEEAPKPKAAVVPPAAPDEVGEGDVVTVKTSLVSIPFSAVDAVGKPVVDLRADEVGVYEDGAEQRVAFFTETEQVTFVVLVLDVSGSVQPSLKGIKEAALSFIEHIRQNDFVYIIAFSDRIRPITPEATNDKAALRAAVEGFRGGGGGTGLYATLHLVNQRILNRVRGRRALVLFTDGVDTLSRKITGAHTLEEAEELGFPVYTVRFPALGGGPASTRSYVEYLRALAEKTGGLYFEGGDTRQVRESFAAIAEELRRQYIIGYYPAAAAESGRERRVRLKIARPGLRAQTNKTAVRIE